MREILVSKFEYQKSIKWKQIEMLPRVNWPQDLTKELENCLERILAIKLGYLTLNYPANITFEVYRKIGINPCNVRVNMMTNNVLIIPCGETLSVEPKKSIHLTNSFSWLRMTENIED